MRTFILVLATLGLGLLTTCAMASTVYTYVPIPTSNNIQTGLISTFPTGIFTANNSLATPFDITGTGTNCGPSHSAACNFYDGFSGQGSAITLNLSVASPTNVYTLMNEYAPAGGQELASIEFLGTGGTSLTYELVGGSDIRDFYHGFFTNTLTNGVAGVNALNAFTCVDPTSCLGSGATGNVNTGDRGTYVVDEQDFSLGSTFAGQTLTTIVIRDTYGGSTPLVLGVTVGTSSTTTPSVPEPASLELIGCAAAGLLLIRRIRSGNRQRN